ncbi:MAG: DUF2752 domain-containing protein [Solirubrobacterales bacterium]
MIDSNRVLVVGAVLALPLVAGFILPASLIEDGHALCIFRELTGLPCPFCGASRAFIAFGHAQDEWWKFNGYWVLLCLAALIGVTALTATKLVSNGPTDALARRWTQMRQSSWITTALIALVVAPGWIWAVANRQNIT